MKYFNRKFIRNKKGGVSVVIGSLLMASILISTTGALVIISSQNNTRAIERNNLANQMHAELLAEMQAFYDYLESTMPGNPNIGNNSAPIILWAGPIEESVETPASPQVCKVHVFDPDDDSVTIWFYRWGENVLINPVPEVEVQTVSSNTNASFNFIDTESGKTYYWSVAICDPWHIQTSELYSFVTS